MMMVFICSHGMRLPVCKGFSIFFWTEKRRSQTSSQYDSVLLGEVVGGLDSVKKGGMIVWFFLNITHGCKVPGPIQSSC